MGEHFAVCGNIRPYLPPLCPENQGGAGQDSGQSAGRGQGGAVQNAEG